MTIDLKSLTQSILSVLFNLGGDIVKDGTYTRPMSLATTTGLSAPNEVNAAVKVLIAAIPANAPRLRGSQRHEKVLIRASELTGITVPAAGDYITESITGLRRDVLSAMLDPTAQVWSFNTVRSLHQDWGDLTAHNSSEDWGDLTTATDIEDRGALYE